MNEILTSNFKYSPEKLNNTLLWLTSSFSLMLWKSRKRKINKNDILKETIKQLRVSFIYLKKQVYYKKNFLSFQLC